MNRIGRKAKHAAAKQVYLNWSKMLGRSVRSHLGRSAVWAVGLAVLPSLAHAQASFSEKVYPVLEKAGCRNCHNVEGVASATRLHFPEEAAGKDRIEAFGRSLVEFVDRSDPGQIVRYFRSPPCGFHTPAASASAKGALRKRSFDPGLNYLASLQGAELAEALRYRQARATRIWSHAQSSFAPADAQPIQQHGARPAQRTPAIPRASFRPRTTSTGSRTNMQALSRSRRSWPRLIAGPPSGLRRTHSGVAIRAA